MTAPPAPRSSAEIRQYLIGRLNHALRRPEMFGGEVALRLLLDHLAYVDKREASWAAEWRVMEGHGTHNALGVTGAFQAVMPGDCGHGVASAYAEFVRACGWLEVTEVLSADEYAAMDERLDDWAVQDHTLSEVVDTFGAPSVLFGGSSPLYGKTLGYVAMQSANPMIFFHLWNGTDPGDPSSRRPVYSEPLLLAIRRGSVPFCEAFTFTPEGCRRRPETG
ncbi:hypothetical protein ACIBG8_42040 [Nonomuraea sp. NPDC050556]|uniref:hypothetical protein n=1 Tax=Nonomuraea sp. NPDC050556 TaxID=3364369 RepID=UPI0037B063DE